jgi:hypothetical protein
MPVRVIHTCGQCGCTASQSVDEYIDWSNECVHPPEGWFEFEHEQYCPRHRMVEKTVIEDILEGDWAALGKPDPLF